MLLLQAAVQKARERKGAQVENSTRHPRLESQGSNDAKNGHGFPRNARDRRGSLQGLERLTVTAPKMLAENPTQKRM